MSGRRSPQLASITGLRGLAASLVVLSHMRVYGDVAHTAHFGEVGVLIFFTLSGFLMALLYLQEPFDLDEAAKYAIARFARIAPAYLTVVGCSYLIYNFIDPQFVYSISNGNLLRHVLFSGNVGPLWSIPPEVQFYVVFAFLWFAVDRISRHKKSDWLLLFVVFSVLCFIFRDRLPGTFVGSKLHFFVFGACAGAIRRKLERHVPSTTCLVLSHLALLIACALIASGIAPMGFLTQEAMYSSLGNAITVALAILLLSFPSAVTRLLLENPLAMMLGTWSFSIYLLHAPLIKLSELHLRLRPDVEASAVLAFVGFASFLNFRLIERPGANFIRRVAGRISGNPSVRSWKRLVH